MRITIYSKPGCHLCDEMKDVVARVLHSAQHPEWKDTSFEEIDITTDPDLAERYGLEIPLLWIDGRKIAKYRVSEKELIRKLRTASE